MEDQRNREFLGYLSATCLLVTFLLMLFPALKAVGILHWSWFWVTSPLWGMWVAEMAMAAVGEILIRSTPKMNGVHPDF